MKRRFSKSPQYHMEVNLRLKDSPEPWKWEIYATGTQLFVAQSDNGFGRREEAVEAGKRALQQWLQPAVPETDG
jgi:hypothetical protein